MRQFFLSLGTVSVPRHSSREIRLRAGSDFKDVLGRFSVHHLQFSARGRHAHGGAVLFGGDGTRLLVSETASPWRRTLTKRGGRIRLAPTYQQFPFIWETLDMTRLKVTNLGAHRLTVQAVAAGWLLDHSSIFAKTKP